MAKKASKRGGRRRNPIDYIEVPEDYDFNLDSDDLLGSIIGSLLGRPQTQLERPPYSIRLPIPRTVPDMVNMLSRAGIQCMYREEDQGVVISDLHSLKVLVTTADGSLRELYIALTGFTPPAKRTPE